MNVNCGRNTLAAAVLAVLMCNMASARDLWESADGDRSFSLETALKATGVFSRAPEDPLLYPDRESSSSFLRGRLTFQFRMSEIARLEFAYEQRVRMVSEGAGQAAGGGLLPSQADAPFRIEQLDWDIRSNSDTFSYRDEIDRAFVAIDLEFGSGLGQLTIGRQSIGMGRGVFFGAIDLFSPFSPVEVDREWRRGVDAVRFDMPLADTISCDLSGAFGEDWSNSALVGRIRGYNAESGNDLGVVFGKRGEDGLLGASTSFRVGEAAMYVDLALFNVPEHAGDGELFGWDNYTSKAVIGFSHKLGGGDGPTIMAEYHYSGFGVSDIIDATARLFNPTDSYGERLLRGDMQILGQHALGVQASWEVGEASSFGVTLITSPADWSGMIQPTYTWNYSDNITIVASGAVAYGDESEFGVLQSEYGASASSLFLQIRMYD